MAKHLSIVLALCSLLSAVTAQNFLLLADVHLNVNSTNQYVRPGDETSPAMLINVLDKAAKAVADSGTTLDAILLVGDLCRHGLSSSTDTNPEWPLMQYTMAYVMGAIQTAFPGVPILPVIGNNDVQYHN